MASMKKEADEAFKNETKEGKKFFGIQTKESFSRVNILSLFLIAFFSVMVSYSNNALK
jgi:hypothetical protein